MKTSFFSQISYSIAQTGCPVSDISIINTDNLRYDSAPLPFLSPSMIPTCDPLLKPLVNPFQTTRAFSNPVTATVLMKFVFTYPRA